MSTVAAPRPGAPLDDVMLAMDVVDTLRQRQDLIERELDEPARAKEIVGRLRRIYAAQGIDVPDDILEQGVAALREERFVYRPPRPSFATAMARAYVARRRWGTLLVAVAAVAALAIGTYRNEVVAPRNALPAELAATHAATLQLAIVPAATDRAEALYAAAVSALRARDYGAARSAMTDLQTLRSVLEQSYSVRIVNRPGEASGVWRVPDVNPSARNYYLIVEAQGPDGRVLTVPVRSEETGTSSDVRSWGVRVDEGTFQRVLRDKQDDGIIQDDVVGTKRPGTLTPSYTIPTSGASITRW